MFLSPLGMSHLGSWNLGKWGLEYKTNIEFGVSPLDGNHLALVICIKVTLDLQIHATCQYKVGLVFTLQCVRDIL